MAAVSRVYTVQLVAKMLGRHEDLIWSLADQLDLEDGALWILDIDNGETLAFTSHGIETLREIIADQVDRSEKPSWDPCGGPGRTRPDALPTHARRHDYARLPGSNTAQPNPPFFFTLTLDRPNLSRRSILERHPRKPSRSTTIKPGRANV